MGHVRGWYNPLAVIQSIAMRPRFYAAALVGALALAFLPQSWPRMARDVAAWDLGGLTYLFFALRLVITCGADRIKARAARRDDSRLVILTIILLGIAASFAAIAGLIGEAKAPATGPSEKLILGSLAVLTIMISWIVTQVAFALHYAHAYYRPDEGSDAGAGLDFPACDQPDYWDFLYFSTSIGATSQTSDVSIKSRALRRLVTLHATVSFFFNTAVLALTVNIAASLAG
ncbi:MAG: DUF1345 domain-containing protein [Rhodomicrobium sp.]